MSQVLIKKDAFCWDFAENSILLHDTSHQRGHTRSRHLMLRTPLVVMQKIFVSTIPETFRPTIQTAEALTW